MKLLQIQRETAEPMVFQMALGLSLATGMKLPSQDFR